MKKLIKSITTYISDAWDDIKIKPKLKGGQIWKRRDGKRYFYVTKIVENYAYIRVYYTDSNWLGQEYEWYLGMFGREELISDYNLLDNPLATCPYNLFRFIMLQQKNEEEYASN